MRVSRKGRMTLISAAICLLATGFLPCQTRRAPIREVYVFSASHLDPTFTGPPPFSYGRFHRIFDAALKLVGEQPDFRFVVENIFAFDQYLRTHPDRQAAFQAPVKNGHVEFAGQVSIVLQNVATGEDLVRNVLLAREFIRDRFGVLPKVQTLSDAPGQTPQVPQILARSGLGGLIITRAGPRDAHLFDWEGLDGSRVRVASLPLGYAGGYLMGMAASLEAMEGTRLVEFELSDISPEIFTNKLKQPAAMEPMLQTAYASESGRALVEVGWDNAIPQAEVAKNIVAWNTKHGNRLRLIPSSPGDFFEKHWPEKVPVKKGEISSVWGNGWWSLIGGYAQHFRTTHKLLRAEKWASMAEVLTGSRYPGEDLRRSWWDHLLSLDHESAELTQPRVFSESLASRALQDAQQAIASHVAIPQKMDVALVVFNPMNWSRSEIVTAQVYFVGDPFAFFTRPFHKLKMVGPDGKPVPFEVVSTQSTIVRSAWIRFRADSVPPLGWKTYFLRPAEKNEARTFPKPTDLTGESTIRSGSLEIAYRPDGGSFILRNGPDSAAAELSYHHQPEETSSQPGFFRQKDKGDPVRVSWKRVAVGENLGGPYFEAEGEIQGAELRANLQLADTGQVTVSETVRTGGGKQVKLIRQVELPEKGQFYYGVPFGTVRLGDSMESAGPSEQGGGDEIPRAMWITAKEFDGWVAWRGNGQQVTIAGEARGGRFTDRSLKVTLLYSDGKPMLADTMIHPVPNEFVTRLLIGFSPRPEDAPRLGWELYNPLETMVSVRYQKGSLPAEYAGTEESAGTVLSALKKSEDGKGWIARAYASESEASFPPVLAARARVVGEVDLVEQIDPGRVAGAGLKPFEIRTVLLEEKR
ncbi:MAG: hypothetical protein HXY20_11365 [Acidobacteria bacterium]|nr:hypothetical protein [Acidobacteriota bacterium]